MRLIHKTSLVFSSLLGLSVLPACLPEAPKAPDAPAAVVEPMPEPTLTVGVKLSARATFNQKVLPLLLSTCGTCHKVDGGIGPAFLASSTPSTYDPYLTAARWNNFIVANPELSQLLRKGQHEGPALTLDQYAATLEWLQIENEERAATSVVAFKPQIPPFLPTVSEPGVAPAVNKIPIDVLNPNDLSGAYLQFKAVRIGQGNLTRAIEISDLRIFNVKAGSKAGDQRSIRTKRPLFVTWHGSTPLPDPIDSFNSTDMTTPLETVPTPLGVTIVPGLLTLTDWRPGNALSISFDLVQLVPPSTGSNPCSAMGLPIFISKIKPYLARPNSCTGMTQCHSLTGNAAGLVMTAALLPDGDPKVAPLCEALKFYNSTNRISNNTNPAGGYSHPFKWSDANCTANGLPTGCFTTFDSDLKAWIAKE